MSVVAMRSLGRQLWVAPTKYCATPLQSIAFEPKNMNIKSARVQRVHKRLLKRITIRKEMIF